MPESLTHVVDTAHEWINAIAKDMEVTHFLSLGLRCEFFAPQVDIVKGTAMLAKNVSSDLFRALIAPADEKEDATFQYMVRLPVKKFIAVIRAHSVRIVREASVPTHYSSDGLIFDVDVVWRRSTGDGIPRKETRGFLASSSAEVYDLLEDIGYNLLKDGDGTNGES